METQWDRRKDINFVSFVWIMVIHALCPAVCIGLAIFAVPRFANLFSDMGDGATPLPWLTICLLSVSSWITQRWYLAIYLLIVLLAVDGLVFYGLNRGAGEKAGRLWSAIVLLGQLTFLAIGLAAIMIPVVQMTNESFQ